MIIVLKPQNCLFYQRKKKFEVGNNPLIKSQQNVREKKIFMVDRESYMKIAQEAVDKGFITFSPSVRLIYQRNVEKFLEFYTKNYDNEFAKNFEIITSLQVLQTKEELFRKIHSITNRLKNEYDDGIFILYRIINKSKQFVRIGYTSDIIQRLEFIFRIHSAKS